MKKLYQQPEMEILRLTLKDCITDFETVSGVGSLGDYIGDIMSDPGFEDGVEDEW